MYLSRLIYLAYLAYTYEERKKGEEERDIRNEEKIGVAFRQNNDQK